MKKIFFGLLFVGHVVCATNEIADLLHKLDVARPYQDVIVNGQILYKGFSSTQYAKRLACIESVIKARYGDRAITVFDIGAAQGFFDFSLGFKYPNSTFVMVDSGQSSMVKQDESASTLLRLCQLNDSLKNIIFLNIGLTAKNIENMGKSEHFDVVLALNVLHHFVRDWRAATDAILALGDTIILELPTWGPGYGNGKPLVIADMNLTEINKYVISRGARVIGKVDRLLPKQIGVLYLIEKEKQANAQGILVSTFEHYNGRYPDPKQVSMACAMLPLAHDKIRLKGTAGVVKVKAKR